MQNLSQNEFNKISKMHDLSQDELEKIAKIRKIKNYEDMRKEDLIISLFKSKESIDELFNDNNGNEISDKRRILNRLKNILPKKDRKEIKENLSFFERNLKQYLDNISIPLLSEEKKNSCEGEITEEEILKALKSMKNNKSPGNDGMSKEFYQTFWNDLKNVFLPAIKKAYHTKKLSYSQYQAVIRLIEKKGRDKRFIKNWRPISLLNVNTKLISFVRTLKKCDA